MNRGLKAGGFSTQSSSARDLTFMASIRDQGEGRSLRDQGHRGYPTLLLSKPDLVSRNLCHWKCLADCLEICAKFRQMSIPI